MTFEKEHIYNNGTLFNIYMVYIIYNIYIYNLPIMHLYLVRDPALKSINDKCDSELV